MCIVISSVSLQHGHNLSFVGTWFEVWVKSRFWRPVFEASIINLTIVANLDFDVWFNLLNLFPKIRQSTFPNVAVLHCSLVSRYCLVFISGKRFDESW